MSNEELTLFMAMEELCRAYFVFIIKVTVIKWKEIRQILIK